MATIFLGLSAILTLFWPFIWEKLSRTTSKTTKYCTKRAENLNNEPVNLNRVRHGSVEWKVVDLWNFACTSLINVSLFWGLFQTIRVRITDKMVEILSGTDIFPLSTILDNFVNVVPTKTFELMGATNPSLTNSFSWFWLITCQKWARNAKKKCKILPKCLQEPKTTGLLKVTSEKSLLQFLLVFWKQGLKIA